MLSTKIARRNSEPQGGEVQEAPDAGRDEVIGDGLGLPHGNGEDGGLDALAGEHVRRRRDVVNAAAVDDPVGLVRVAVEARDDAHPGLAVGVVREDRPAEIPDADQRDVGLDRIGRGRG